MLEGRAISATSCPLQPRDRRPVHAVGLRNRSLTFTRCQASKCFLPLEMVELELGPNFTPPARCHQGSSDRDGQLQGRDANDAIQATLQHITQA